MTSADVQKLALIYCEVAKLESLKAKLIKMQIHNEIELTQYRTESFGEVESEMEYIANGLSKIAFE